MTEAAAEQIYQQLVQYREVLGADAEAHGARWPEISDGRLIMMMSPRLNHQFVGHLLRKQIEPQLPDGLIPLIEADMEDPGLGILRTPDLAVVEETPDLPSRRSMDPHNVHLIIEIVSRWNSSNDYRDKAEDYPAMGIPHYLIVDPREGTCHHFWKPGKGADGRPAYEAHEPYKFGDTLTVNGWSIDSSKLSRYEPAE
jgi:Uma2 family endonuclease